MTCPRCSGTEHRFFWHPPDVVLQGMQEAVLRKVGSIFEDSPSGLDKWMTAFWMVFNCKNGVSSAEMARTLKITQKSAWFMLHRVREVLANKSFGNTTSSAARSKR